MPIPRCPKTATAGRNCSASACAVTSRKTSDSSAAWPAITTFMVPCGTWDGGREKAPAAICRKVIQAKRSGSHEIEIWGDGHQTRSFMYIDDCTHGTLAIMESDIDEPINLGSSELVTINQLVDIVEEIAGVKLKRHYNLSAPKGVNGRNSDNTLILEKARLGTLHPPERRNGKDLRVGRKPDDGWRPLMSRMYHRDSVEVRSDADAI